MSLISVKHRNPQDYGPTLKNLSEEVSCAAGRAQGVPSPGQLAQGGEAGAREGLCVSHPVEGGVEHIEQPS